MPTSDLLTELDFRPITPGDLPFLSRLYASTRQDELAVTDWTDEEKAAFLQMQFEAQHSHYQKHYPSASFEVIEQGGSPIGRLYVDTWEDEYRLIDIALLPEHRNHGIGSAILHDLLAKAEAANKAIRIHVEHDNPALKLYQRLGFRQVKDVGVYAFMEWLPTKAEPVSEQGTHGTP